MAELYIYYPCETALVNNNLLDTVSNLYNTPVLNGSITTVNPKYGTSSLSIPTDTAYINTAGKIDCSATGAAPNNGVFSVAMWFKTSSSANIVNLFCISPDNAPGASIPWNTASMIRLIGTASTINESTLTTLNIFINQPTGQNKNLRDGAWHHIAWVGFGNQTTRIVYIDGILWGNTGPNGTGAPYTAPTYNRNCIGNISRIGSSSWAAPEALLGSVDEIQIYKGLLTQSDVITIYNGNVACFNKGTQILCLNNDFEEVYVNIEELKKGDIVKSYKHGYRKLENIHSSQFINNPEIFSTTMYKMEKTKENGLTNDLLITGGHSILVDDLKECKEENTKKFGGVAQMIDDKYLLLSSVSKDFIKIEGHELFIYYHFILENNGDEYERFGVWANGVLSETPTKNNFEKIMQRR